MAFIDIVARNDVNMQQHCCIGAISCKFWALSLLDSLVKLNRLSHFVFASVSVRPICKSDIL